MQRFIALSAAALALTTLTGLAAQAQTQASSAQEQSHGHAHDHGAEKDHSTDAAAIYKGYFEDSQIAARPLSDWAGDWQSVYPHLQAGQLDSVMAHKAAHGDKTAEDYRSYYEIGYRTDVDRIVISEDRVTFHRDGGAVDGRYEADGYEILTYEKGNRGVRFVFAKRDGDEDAPAFIQFSDHRIAPEVSDHYHLYWGDDRAALLTELTNWPTYYPSALSVDEIVHEMVAH